MNTHMNDRIHMRLYAVTCIACIGWLAQSIYENRGKSAFFSVSTMILWVCILIAIVYTGVNAAMLWHGFRRDCEGAQKRGEKCGAARAARRRVSRPLRDDDTPTTPVTGSRSG